MKKSSNAALLGPGSSELWNIEGFDEGMEFKTLFHQHNIPVIPIEPLFNGLVTFDHWHVDNSENSVVRMAEFLADAAITITNAGIYRTMVDPYSMCAPKTVDVFEASSVPMRQDVRYGTDVPPGLGPEGDSINPCVFPTVPRAFGRSS